MCLCLVGVKYYICLILFGDFMVDVRFGLRVPAFPVDGSGFDVFVRQIYDFLGRFEGEFDSAWICDHLYPWADFVDRTVPNLECFTSIAYLSAIYRKYKWGSIVLCNNFRSPVLVAKMGAILQNLCGGRFILGIGAGWKRDEYIAYGFEFPSARVRVEMLEEAVQIIRLMWRDGRASFHGKYYRVDDAICMPKPNPIPPLMIGGGGEKYTLRVVAKFADWWNIPNVSPKIYRHKLNVLEGHCRRVGRDFDEIVKTLANMVAIARSKSDAIRIARGSPFVRRGFEENYIIGNPEMVVEKLKEYVRLGVSVFILRFLDFPSMSGAELFVNEVIPKFA